MSGFWTKTPTGNIAHVRGDRNMSEEALKAIHAMMDAAVKMVYKQRYGLTEYRADGWPLCPQCGEDELYSLLNWDGQGERPELTAYIVAGLRCYKCGWNTEVTNAGL